MLEPQQSWDDPLHSISSREIGSVRLCPDESLRIILVSGQSVPRGWDNHG